MFDRPDSDDPFLPRHKSYIEAVTSSDGLTTSLSTRLSEARAFAMKAVS